MLFPCSFLTPELGALKGTAVRKLSADERRRVFRRGETNLVWPALLRARAAVGPGARVVAVRTPCRCADLGGGAGEAAVCVEASIRESHVLVRDSNLHQNAVLSFRHAAWCGFLAGLVDPGADGS
ncbi:DUF397 domain-containing protein [Streptomyces sp. NPDC057474]|uniref:DUF397 domain-containing protein n=1 Tax=Streptomyces sp. NPDC057474 TaxID=3346144 RepID=UPI0036AA4AA4